MEKQKKMGIQKIMACDEEMNGKNGQHNGKRTDIRKHVHDSFQSQIPKLHTTTPFWEMFETERSFGLEHHDDRIED